MHYRLGAAALALTLGVGCSNDDYQSSDVLSVYDKTADFSQYDSFEFTAITGEGSEPNSWTESNKRAMREAVIRELQAQGLQQVSDSPDLKAAVFFMADEHTSDVTGYWYEYYWGYYWGYYYEWFNEEVTFEVGTVIIDVVDTLGNVDEADDALVFRGITAEVLPNRPQDYSARIDWLVTEIFKGWPEVNDDQ